VAQLQAQIDAGQTKTARIHVSSSMSKGSAAWDQSSAWESGLVTTVHTVGSRNALQKIVHR